MWVGTHPTKPTKPTKPNQTKPNQTKPNQTKPKTWQWQWAMANSLTLFKVARSLGLELKNEWRKVKSRDQINSNQIIISPSNK
jgi:hypothetical protein